MKDQSKTKQVLIQELDSLRQKIAEFEQSETEQKQVKETMISLKRLIDAAPDSITVHDFDGNFIYANQKTFEIHGYSREEFSAATLHDIDVPESKELITSRMQQILETGEASFEVSHFRKDGITFPLMVHAVIGNWGEKKVIFSVARDMTDRKRAEEALKESEGRYKRLLESVTDYIYTVQVEDGRPVATAHGLGCAAVTGYTTEDYQVDPYLWHRMVYAQDRDIVTEHAARVIAGETTAALEHRIVHRDGSIRWVRNTPVPHYDEHRCLVAYDGLISNITERKRAEEALGESEKKYRELSITDNLTNLYNSRYFYNQLKMEIDRVNRYGQSLTLLLLDIDGFKAINDNYGHIEGDQVLWRLGQVVKGCLRQTDSAYRYGGEEFTILLPMTTSEDGAVIAERIRAELKKEIFSPVSGKHIYITVSIGLAQYKPQEDMKAFVHRVDQLMYQAKKNGKDRVCAES